MVGKVTRSIAQRHRLEGRSSKWPAQRPKWETTHALPILPGRSKLVKMLGMRYHSPAVIAMLLCTLASAWAQRVTCSPCSYDFGAVAIGSSNSYSIQLTNTGTETLNLLSQSGQGGSFSFGNLTLPMQVAPWSTVQVPVTFRPTTEGATSGVLQLASNAANSPLALSVSGTGTGQTASGRQLQVSPATIAFGKVPVGAYISRKATLTAPGGAVTIASDQSSNSEFAIEGMKLPKTIPAGGSIEVTIRFTPAAPAAVAGKATFTSPAIKSPATLQLTGEGIAGKAKPELTISPTTIGFGSVTVGSNTSKMVTFKASNAAVTISADTSTSSEFEIVGLKLPYTIAAGKTLEVTLEFKPTAAGALSGKTSFTSSAANSPATVALTGVGVAAVSGQLSVSPTTLGFGNVTVGSSATHQATLTASNDAVTISSDQSTSHEFTIVGLKLPVTIAAGKTLAVTVQFAPTASGAASVKAGFISNAANSPTVEEITGTGIAQTSHSVDLSWSPGVSGTVGYNVYRGIAQSGPFTQLNTALDSTTTYTDSTVVSGTTYYYVATEINGQGDESAYSNVAMATIP
jgi:hypothetical protein